MRKRGNEFGSVTGRPRRCGWLDIAALKRSLQLNGVDGLCITKLDVLDGMDEITLCTRYTVDGEPLAPASDRAPKRSPSASPSTKRCPAGARAPSARSRSTRCRANARAYLQRIEALTGVPIAMVSTGPDRSETILVHHPFE